MREPIDYLLVQAIRVLSLALAMSFLSAGAGAQQATSAPADDLQTVLQHMHDLEGQVAALKAQVQTLNERAAETPSSAAGSGPVAEKGMSETTAMPEPAPDSGNSPHLQIRGYGDVDWSASDLKGTTNAFALGQFDLFITSRLTDRVRFLSETVVEANESDNNFNIELERMELIYAMNDRLNLQFGRYHTAIGYYNTAYHHSALMQTTIGRPFLFAFEDHGGVLPVHSVGLSATGLVSTRLGLHYIAELGNGRDPRAESISGVNAVQNITDDNNGKAFNLGVFARPDFAPGLQIGFSNYHDHVTPPGKSPVTENILSLHAIFQNPQFEFLNEAVLLRHTTQGSTINIPAFYSQVSRKFGRYRPYFRYEYLHVPAKDQLYSSTGLRHGPLLGLRYDLNLSAAFKIEYVRTMQRGVGAVNSLGTQLAFAF